jgi:hypothetical protein
MDARELCEAAELKMTADAALHLQADDAELTRRLPRAAPEHRSDDTAGIIAQRLALYQAAEVGVPQRHAVRAADLPPGEPAEVARNARRPGARGVVGRLQPDVAAAPAAPPQPPPGAPHRAGTRVQVQIGTMPAAPARHGRRPADIGTRRRRHAGLRPATGHGNLLVLAGAVPCTSKKEPRFCRCTTAGTARSQLPGSGATLSHYASAAHPHRPYTHRRPGDPWSCRRRARRTTAADEPYARGEQCEPRVLALRLS